MHILDDIGTDRAGEDDGPGVGVAGGLAIAADDGDSRSRSHCVLVIDPAEENVRLVVWLTIVLGFSCEWKN